MINAQVYSARTVFHGMKRKLHQYLEAQYHIWDERIIADRVKLLETPGVTFQEPRIEATPSYLAGERYSSLRIPEAAKEILTSASSHKVTGIPEAPYHHQAEALEAFLGNDLEIIVATGTGSGKTECFLMPILGTLAVEAKERPRSWLAPGFRALLLYPMNALVNDQISRLRRILGNEEVAHQLKGDRSNSATFGMYTSRTPYPGEESAEKNEQRLESLINKKFNRVPPDAKSRLIKEGMWPGKDLTNYVAASFQTGPNDSEMFSRQEMQHHCPDILVTNYSMLEYMLLRPIERSIFDQTSSWLANDDKNKLVVVLDEAHMYRGSSGAEVAYLLRRLHARLGISRSRVRYILTSASLGSSENAKEGMKDFAAQLTGHEVKDKDFFIVTGKQQVKPGARIASPSEAAALADYEFQNLHVLEGRLDDAIGGYKRLCRALDSAVPVEIGDAASLQDAIYRWLKSFGPAAFLANKITSRPQHIQEIAAETFPDSGVASKALESLLALMSFAKEAKSGSIFLPVRAHLFFRGLPGIYACVNPECKTKGSPSGILGSLYATPKLQCACGARVYELMTHRDCGAAYIRGYVRDSDGDFLWHQPSKGLWQTGGLLEAHFLVEPHRAIDEHRPHEGSLNWLHKTTGRLSASRPEPDKLEQFIEVLRPDRRLQIVGQEMLTFNGECPVCKVNWRAGTTKIMDLATKGEAPFAQLIRTQVELQPSTIHPSNQSPNAGRKALLFSDGRQKAARLARDIPREIENDVFRQLLLLGAKELVNIGREPRLPHLYVAVVHVLARHSLILLDGTDKELLQEAVQNHRRYYEDDLEGALQDRLRAPPSFEALLLRHLGAPFYCVSALTLAHLTAIGAAQKAIESKMSGIARADMKRLLVSWIQSFAGRFAVDASVPRGIREKAAGYPIATGLDAKGGFNRHSLNFLRNRIPGIDSIFQVFDEYLCQASPHSSGRFIDANKLSLVLANEESWFQCSRCAAVTPVDWWGHCSVCLSEAVTPVNPGATDYLRARKAFFRDPVIDVLEGRARPFNLCVEEHTAQLSYRDLDDVTTTTEDFERRFRDILVEPTDTSIDVLSSTTTMEVGIDIGSLVAVGLRNVPPLRQNYQQRAGRTGRRGSTISTVVTYAQSSPHDSYYFENPEGIIRGDPTLPTIDTANQIIVERHIRAQLIQTFFHFESPIPGGSDIFSVLGKTMEFYQGSGPFTLGAFEQWIGTAPSAREIFAAIQRWLPPSFSETPPGVAKRFIQELKRVRPASADDLDAAEERLIEFLFSRGFLPSYAFPRDLCALQIERPPDWSNRFGKIGIVQRPQQGLSVALSEYAPGRFVVVDKKTYRVGTVAANGSSAIENRAARLFSEKRYYVFCPKCEFTPGFRNHEPAEEACPLCAGARLEAKGVIVPQVVFPAGRREVDEHDDEQLFTNATNAQLSVPEDASFTWRVLGVQGKIAFVRNQHLVMVNKGEEENGQHDGFLICNQCGKAAFDNNTGAHDRDYYISGRGRPSRCQGQFERVYLGYGFSSDVLILRLPIGEGLRFDPVIQTERAPIADAMQSLAEGFVLAISRELDIDLREIDAGFRFMRVGNENFADIFVYDTLAGGAGYATQAGEVMNRVLTRLEGILGGCNCSSSCSKCLRHYGNRFHHANLDRILALDLLRYIRDAALPEQPSIEEQRQILAPLSKLLELAGWKIHDTSGPPVTAIDDDGAQLELYSYPSLVQPAHYRFVDGPGRFAFSAYELSHDLPGAFGRL